MSIKHCPKDLNWLWPGDAISLQKNFINTGSGNGLLSDSTKPLPEPVSTNHASGLVAFTWGQLYRKCSNLINLKITSPRHENMRYTITWTYGGPFYWRINASQSLSVLPQLYQLNIVICTPYWEFSRFTRTYHDVYRVISAIVDITWQNILSLCRIILIAVVIYLQYA